MRNAIEINWKILGAKLAISDDSDQIQFFEGFAHEMNAYETRIQAEMQMAAVANNINKSYKPTLKNLLSIIYEED